jgi:hypothetical protein
MKPSTAEMPSLLKTDIIATIEFLHPGDEVFEICAFDRYGKPLVGWFRDKEQAVAEVQRISKDRGLKAVYITLNPCHDALLSRSNEQIKSVKSRTQDVDILSINNLYIDPDPVRPADTNSSDEEHELAIEKTHDIKRDLSEQGLPEPLCGASGNGGMLVYRIEPQPNTGDTKKLIQAVLKALAERYDTTRVKIDQSVHNPARIAKLLGTMTRKGDPSPDRPQRLSEILSIPEKPEFVTLKQLEEIASTVKQETQPQTEDKTDNKLDVEKYLTHYGIEIVKTKRNGTSTLYCLKECVFDPSHAPNEAAIVQADSGALSYQCFHNSCQGRTWKEARQVISGDDKLTQFMSGNHTGTRKDVTKDTFVTSDQDEKIIPKTDFPFDSFNDNFLQIVNIISNAIHIEPEIAAAVMLAILSGAVGNTLRVSPKKGYTVPLFIWLIVIAHTGYGKSPLMTLLMRHIKKMQSKDYLEFEKELKTYEKALRDAKNDNTLLIPEIPRLRHYEVADNTVEALINIFIQDPRGPISNPDEIGSLINGLNQYKGKGNDQEQYLSFFNCGSTKVDRKGKTIFAPNTGLAIIGGIQPKKMPGIFDDDAFDDGFTGRFLTINAHGNSMEFSRDCVTDETIRYWTALIDYCYSIPLKFDDNGFVEFKTLILSEDAIESYISFYNDYGKKMLFLTERARVFIPKLLAYYCLKFAGILHVLNCYQDKIDSAAIPQLIDGGTMHHAIELTKYFTGQAIETVRLYDGKKSLNEFQEVLIQVLYDMREKVTGGKILLSRIREVYNSRIPSEMTHHAVSAMLRDFGLITEKKGLNQSYLLWEPRKIEKLFSRKKVTKVTNGIEKDHEQHKDVTFDTFVTLIQENKTKSFEDREDREDKMPILEGEV